MHAHKSSSRYIVGSVQDRRPANGIIAMWIPWMAHEQTRDNGRGAKWRPQPRLSVKMALRGRVGTFALVLVVAGVPVVAQPPLTSCTYSHSNVGTRLAACRELAKAGEPRAQTMLGIMLEVGEGIEPDLVKAAYWYRLAAEAGDTEGASLYGRALLHGYGLSQNISEAVRWLRPAAEAGAPFAQFEYGRLHAVGREVPLSPTAAARWIRLAAEGGHSEAQHIFGLILADGDGVEADPETAVEWHLRSAAQGWRDAQIWLARAYERGDMGVNRNPALAYAWWTIAGDEIGRVRVESLLEFEELSAAQRTVERWNPLLESLRTPGPLKPID